ncbi:MAG: hypothetical protein Fur0037_05480 [Planctomycetota bacterium]
MSPESESPESEQAPARALGAAFWIGVAALAFLVQGIVRLAWVGDDAFITLRTVENWLSGHGLRWNTADRAQSFTTPLWMFAMALGRLLTSEAYFTTLALCGVMTAICLALLLRSARGGMASWAMMLLALSGSRAFIDYSTSGLDNPLSHALAAGFVYLWFSEKDRAARLRRLALLSGFIACNRMDHAILCAVPLLAATRGVEFSRAVKLLAIGSFPFLSWVAFSTFYFGTPFPTTAYAKALSHGLPQQDIAAQGLRYFADLALRDPTTAVLIASGLGTGLFSRRRTGFALALGVLAYFGYIVKVGGCFMAGRFFTTPLVFCVGILLAATRDAAPSKRLAAGALLFLISFVAGVPQAVTGSGNPEGAETRWGIHDVRRMGWPHCGLCSPERRIPLAGSLGALARGMGVRGRILDVEGVVGEYGYRAGPDFHIVDYWLCDPVLCRLPAYQREKWIIHHFVKRVPEGYLEFLATGDDSLCHPGFSRFMHAMLEVTRGPLCSVDRIGTIAKMLAGGFDADLRSFIEESYFDPPLLLVRAGDLEREILLDPSRPVFWFEVRGGSRPDGRAGIGARVVYEGGLEVRFDSPREERTMEIVLESSVDYRCEWRAGDRALAAAEIQTTQSLIGGLERKRIGIPEAASGFTAVRIDAARHADRVAAVASLRLVK